MNDISAENPLFQELLEKAREDNRIIAVSVFGSFARGEQYRDIDICLFSNPDINSHGIALEYIYCFGDQFDIKIFNEMPLYIRSRILKEGIILLNKDYDKLLDLYIDTIKDYDLFEPHFNHFLEAIKHG